jgi:hypothetical protein
MSNALAKILAGNDLGKLAYAPHSMAKVQLYYGAPPSLLSGIEYVFASFDNAQTVLKMGLDGGGRYIPNRNQSGTIEFAIIDGTLSNGIVQLALETGIPYPIYVIDTQSEGTSFLHAETCTRVSTPEWRKERAIGMQLYTFQTKKLIMSAGVKSPG